jgi:hypothetical protein
MLTFCLDLYSLEHNVYFRVPITRVQVNQNGLKLNGTHQFLFCADDVNILSGSVHTIKKNTEALLVVSKKIGLEVNIYKTKYAAMSRDQKAGRSHNLKTDIVPL